MNERLVKIAHLSDLHCDSGERWKESFSKLKRALVKLAPDIIVITGDCVESPSKVNFSTLLSELTSLHIEINSSITAKSQNCVESKLKKPFIVPVAGNHDRYWKGFSEIKLFKHLAKDWLSTQIIEILYSYAISRFRANLFQNFQLGLNKALYEVNIDDLLKEIFLSDHVAIFPLDSNGNSKAILAAQGYVDKPQKIISDQIDKYKGHSNEIYDKAMKIILMHHHPLPISASKKDEIFEEFLVLKNSYEVLNAAILFNIDLVFHGHKHAIGASEFKNISKGRHSLIVSSCGKSCSRDEDAVSFKVAEVYWTGACSATTYKSFNEEVDFAKDENNSMELVGYNNIRRKQHSNRNLYDYTTPIKFVKCKTKAVRIRSDGAGLVRITYDKIECEDSREKLFIKETIRGANGRVPLIWNRLSNVVLHYDDDRLNPKSARKAAKSRGSLADEELYEWRVESHPAIDIAKDSFCTIGYIIHNGYAMNDRHHFEMYDIPDGNVQEEISIIHVDYPTRYAELSVEFQDKDYYPDPESVHVQAIPSTNGKFPTTTQIIMNEGYDPSNAETEYLKRQNAIRFRSNWNQIILAIKYPQPDFLYVLKWSVPQKKSRANYNNSNSLYKRIVNNDEAVKVILEKIVLNVKTLFKDVNLEHIIWVFDVERKLLASSLRSPRFANAKSIRVGRSPDGKAFKMRRVEYYNPNIPNYVDDVIPPEQIIENYNPQAIMSIPLFYKNDPLSCLGVISLILPSDEKSTVINKHGFCSLSEFDNLSDDDRHQVITKCYGLINDELVAFSA